MEGTRREALALYDKMQQQTSSWLPHLESMISVLSRRFRALMKSVSSQANGEIRLIVPRAFSPPSAAAAATDAAAAAAAAAAAGGGGADGGGKAAPQEEETPGAPLLQQLSPSAAADAAALIAAAAALAVAAAAFAAAVVARDAAACAGVGLATLLQETEDGMRESILARFGAFAKGSFRVLDEINQGLDSARESLLFSLLSRGRRAAPVPQRALAAAAAAAAEDTSISSRKRQALCLGDSNSSATSSSSSSSKRQRPHVAPDAAASAAAGEGGGEALERQEGGEGDPVEETGGVQYILFSPHIVQEADLSAVCLQFVFSGPGTFTQHQLNIGDQLNRLRAKRKKKP
ncbi:hypothetical protein Emed_001590 [Eimeria media]